MLASNCVISGIMCRTANTLRITNVSRIDIVHICLEPFNSFRISISFSIFAFSRPNRTGQLSSDGKTEEREVERHAARVWSGQGLRIECVIRLTALWDKFVFQVYVRKNPQHLIWKQEEEEKTVSEKTCNAWFIFLFLAGQKTDNTKALLAMSLNSALRSLTTC